MAKALFLTHPLSGDEAVWKLVLNEGSPIFRHILVANLLNDFRAVCNSLELRVRSRHNRQSLLVSFLISS